MAFLFQPPGQDQRSPGNGYFAGQGAETIAHANAREDMQTRGNGQLQSLRSVRRERADGTVPLLPTLDSFALVEQLNPRTVVPGHGEVTDLNGARADTRSYLVALRAHMTKAADDGADISEAIRMFDAVPFMRLLNAAELHPGNASRTYLEVERE